MASRLSLRLEICEKFIQDEVAYVRSRLKEYFPIINCRFKDFTLHDESHISAIESILDWLITEQTLEELNDYDIFCLICSIWAHDIGLGSTVEEIRKFCEHKQIPHPEDNLRTKFVRDNHASLSREIIKKIIAVGHDPRLASLSDIIGQIAESHVFGNLEQIDAYIPVTVTGQIVKPLFLAIIIRLADILHCTHDRAPWILYKARKIEDTVSILHWKRHHATVGVNYDNNTDAYHIHVQTDDIKTFEWAVEYVKMM